jgi:hypothetical protein
MATKPATKKVKNGNLTKNGKPKLKAMNEAQLVDAVNKNSAPAKNATSKFGKLLAKLRSMLFRKQRAKQTRAPKKSSS